jgi:hypothetical protein
MPSFLCLLGALLVSPPVFAAESTAPNARTSSRSTFAIDYRVEILPGSTTVANVRWNFAGIDELRKLRIKVDRERFYDFSGTGVLRQDGDELIWWPRGPYAHLDYKARLRHRRRPGEGFDSYATPRWVITRASALFPSVRATYDLDIERDPRSRATLSFRLPAGWRARTAMEEMSPGSFRPNRRSARLDRPTGWIALGEVMVDERSVGPTRITVARTPDSKLDAAGLVDLYAHALPEMSRLLGAAPARLLVVSGTDPMWHGGLSGDDSLYLHGGRALRTPDRTSPPLHELFHVLAPFRPGTDGVWVTEGLAEFYSLELQRRSGLLAVEDFRRGLRLFEEYGKWHTNLAAAHGGPATNNSAPLLMDAIDRLIRRATGDKRSLDDAVADLSRHSGQVSTAGFLRAVNTVGGTNFASFFQRHVYAGEPPSKSDHRRSKKGETRDENARAPD